MSLILTGNSSSLTIDSNSGITFPNTTNQLSAGQVLQVIVSTYGTQVNNVTTTYTDTGLSATITPKFATSKVLIMCCQQVNVQGGGNDSAAQFRILRDSTTVFETNLAGIYFYVSASSDSQFRMYQTFIYVDSPSTTSATTYKLQGRDANFGSTLIFNNGGSTATITLQEIAA